MSTEHQRGSGRELAGLIIILIGFGLLLNTMNIFPIPYLGLILRFWWPGMLIGLGILLLSRSKGCVSSGGILLLLLGTLFFLNQLNFWRFHFGRMIGPTILIWLGIAMLTRRGRPRTPRIPRSERREMGDRPWERGERYGMNQTVDSSDYITATAVLGGFHRKCDSMQFRGGNVTTIMGGGKLDLRDAKMQADEAVIDVFTIMGGMEIQIPMDWVVEQRFTPILGGYEDKTRRPNGPPSKRLAIEGTTIMGGVSVTN